MGFYQYFAATAAAMKYKWPPRPPKEYPNGMKMDQIDEETFGVSGLTEEQTKLAGYLHTRIRRYTPVATGRMQRNYLVYPLKTAKGWVIVIHSKSWYFRFPYHFYRGEIKYNKSFRFDFIEMGVDDFVAKVGKQPPSVKGKQAPEPPPPSKMPTAEEVKLREKEVAEKLPKPTPPPKAAPPAKTTPVKPVEKPVIQSEANLKRIDTLKGKASLRQHELEVLEPHYKTVKNTPKGPEVKARIDKLNSELEAINAELRSLGVEPKVKVKRPKKVLSEEQKTASKIKADHTRAETEGSKLLKLSGEYSNEILRLEEYEQTPAVVAKIREYTQAQREIFKIVDEIDLYIDGKTDVYPIDAINRGKALPKVKKLSVSEMGLTEAKPVKPVEAPKPAPPAGEPIKVKNDTEFRKYLSDPDKSFSTWRDNLTPDEKSVLRGYQVNNYNAQNTFLRTGKVPPESSLTAADVKEYNAIMDKVVSKKLPEPLEVYRGFNDPAITKILESGDLSSLKGMTYSDKAFMSTTMDKKISDNFVRDQIRFDKTPVQATIKLPAGQSVAPVQDLTGSGTKFAKDKFNESELLLPRDTKFRITNVTQVKKKFKGYGNPITMYQIEMEAI